MKYTITYETEAEHALENIAFYYIEQVGLEMAKAIMDSIKERIESLDTMPDRCQKSSFCQNVHKLVIQKPPYSVYYQILGQEVIILEILHNKQDPKFLQSKYQNF